ncbi:hypothetical protein FRT60_01620 [Pseudomonas haemolytica]|uniref:Uncharacterized protein n=1 Tax=Pseudomonas haemolytica TaxID=2600065 RepID=A0A646NQL8_9PSED|nr:hypothetical protein [Pseudomonas haemolytica]
MKERPLPAGFSRVDEVGKSEAGRFYRTYPESFAALYVGAGLPAMQTPRCIRKTEAMLSQASQPPH